jgi:hypothetical protein
LNESAITPGIQESDRPCCVARRLTPNPLPEGEGVKSTASCAGAPGAFLTCTRHKVCHRVRSSRTPFSRAPPSVILVPWRFLSFVPCIAPSEGSFPMRNVVSLVLGGGRGTRLYPLTKYRSKPAVPLGGKYRLIDIPLSNCINSGMNRMYVLTQFIATFARLTALTTLVAVSSSCWLPSRRPTTSARTGIRGPPTRFGRTSATCNSRVSTTC